MIVRLFTGVAREPLQLDATQLVVLDAQGTPVIVAGEYGPGGIKVAHARDHDFNQTLRAFGFARKEPVVAEVVQLAPLPVGAESLTGR